MTETKTVYVCPGIFPEPCGEEFEDQEELYSHVENEHQFKDEGSGEIGGLVWFDIDKCKKEVRESSDPSWSYPPPYREPFEEREDGLYQVCGCCNGKGKVTPIDGSVNHGEEQVCGICHGDGYVKVDEKFLEDDS